MMKYIVLQQEAAQAILNYLGTCPRNQVNHLCEILEKAPLNEIPDAEQESQSEIVVPLKETPTRGAS